MALDYSKFVDRLTTFNDRGWPSESPIFIKDLVEAGFSYSGESDIVFCYQCGAIANDWKENDNPLKKHETLNRNCLFLQKRLIRLCNGTGVPQPSINENDTFDWVEGQGCVRRNKDENNNDNETVDERLRTNDRPDGEESEPLRNVQEEKKEKRKVDPSMKIEKNRLSSFVACPIYKNWPCVEQLAKAGFYWINQEEVMVCFACACEIKSWDAPDQDIDKLHKSISSSCPFINNLPCGNEELKDEEPEIDLSQLSLKSSNISDQGRKTPTPEGNKTPTPERRRPYSTSYEDPQSQYGMYEDPQRQYVAYEETQRRYPTPPLPYETSHRQYNPYHEPQRQYGPSYQDPHRQYGSTSYEDPRRYSASGAEEDPRRELATSPLLLKIPDRLISSTNSSPSYILSPTSTRRSTITDYDSSQNPLFSPQRVYTECPLSPGSLSRSSSYPPNQENPLEFNAELTPSPMHIPAIDLSNKSVRLKTFLTYPKNAYVQPVELAEAGFYYVNREDGVKCYKCNVMLGNWSPGDTAWNEHRRFSANCALVQEHFGKITSPHHQHQPLQPPHQLTPQPSFLGQYDDGPFDSTLMQRYSPRQHLSPTQPPHTSPRFSRNVPDRRINSHDPCRSLSPGDDLPDDPLNHSWPTNIFRHEQRSLNHHQQQSGSSSGGVQQSLNKSPVHAFHAKTRLGLGSYTRNNSFPEKDFTQRNYSDSSYYDSKSYTSQAPGKLNAADYLKISEQLIHDDQYDSKKHSLYQQQVVKDEVYRRFDERDSPHPLNSANPYGSAVQQTRCSSLHNLSNQRSMPFDYHRQSSDTSHGSHTCHFGHSFDDDMDDRKNCKICMDAAVEVTFVPCGHLVVCQACSQGLTMCPICRKNVDESVRTYFYGN